MPEVRPPSDLATWITRYLAGHTVADDVAALITAAVAGTEPLDASLAGNRVTTATDRAEPTSPESGVYLRRLQVSGFRGIGPAAFIGFQPMPGLTVISGRNGSGKSSFSEAMEVALTGSAHRWQKANTQFEPEHHNLHSPDPCQIRLDLLHDGAEPSRIEVTWEPGAPRETFRRTLQRADRLPEDGIDSLGWDQPLVTYRPLLSYEELGQLPVERHLRDAWALFNDDRMPAAAKAFVIPGVLRMALESAAHERYFTRELGYRRLQDLEREWEDARSTVQKVRLAVAPDEVHVWAYSGQRRVAIGAAGAKNHSGIHPDQLEASMTSKLITLQVLYDGTDVPRLAWHSWRVLSRACHQHAYELSPTYAEVAGWLDVVHQLAAEAYAAARV